MSEDLASGVPAGPEKVTPGEEPARWDAAFARMGTERVRAAVLARAWTPDKLQAARAWVELQDAKRWQEGRPEEGNDGGSVIQAFRSFNWWPLVGPALAIVGLARVLVRVARFH